MSYTLTCGGCGHEAPVPDDPAKSVYGCDQCWTRTAFGVALPRVAVLPHEDRRFVVLRFEHGRGEERVTIAFTLDREFAAAVAWDLLSVTAPGKYRALQAMLAASHAVAAGTVLDGEPLGPERNPGSAPPQVPERSNDSPAAPSPEACATCSHPECTAGACPRGGCPCAAPAPSAAPPPPAAPAPAEGACACGMPSTLANGACASCALAALGGS